MIEKLKELQQKYKEVRELQYQLRREFRNKEVEIVNQDDSFFFDDDCYNFKMGLIEVEDDSIEILYMTEEDGDE